MRCMFHLSYQTVVGWGGVTCSCCHALQPVCACALTWALENRRLYPFISRKELRSHHIPCVVWNRYYWEIFFSLRFYGDHFSKTGHHWTKPGPMPCMKCSRHGALGRAGGRIKAMKVCMGAAPQHFETLKTYLLLFPSSKSFCLLRCKFNSLKW